MRMGRSTKALIGLAVLAGLALLCYLTAGESIGSSDAFLYFRDHVAPVLARTCSSKDEVGVYICHGRSVSDFGDSEKYSAGLQHIFPLKAASSCERCHPGKGGTMRFTFPLASSGEIATTRQLTLAYTRARRYAQLSGARFARILRMPLAAQAGGFGLYHGGGEIFESAADPGFEALARWVTLENAGPRRDEPAVGAAETFFRDEVLPLFARNSCLAPSCHIFNHSSFVPDPGTATRDLAAPLRQRFTREQASFNRMTAKGLIQRLVYFTGDLDESRLLRKTIPIEQGGILHRGGNDQFLTGPDDPDYRTVRKWLQLERDELLAKIRVQGRPVRPQDVGRLRGIVFVRTKTSNPRRYLDVGKYLPGGDLFLLRLSEGETLETASAEPVNLTARFHRGSEADVREPDVRYDGRAILFAMRVGEKDNLNLYEIEIDEGLGYVEGSFRRLTFGPRLEQGISVHYTDPTYVPDPLDENAAGGGYNLDRVDVVFASNLAGEVVQSAERGIVGEADGGDRTTIVDFDRPEPDTTFVGRRIWIVDGTNRGLWRTVTAFRNRLFTREKRSTITVDRPFPLEVDTSTIYVIERETEPQPGFLPSYSVFGVKYPPRGKERAYYEQTLSRITWNPGQDLDLSVRSTGEVFYASQRSACDKYGRPIFHIASCRRHLDTRFSFPTHHGNRSQVLVYADNHELPSGIDIHVGLDPDNLWEGGNLSVSDHQFGPGLEARNPHDYTTGLFDEEGVPLPGKAASHPRFVFKKTPLFPLRGPRAVSRTGLSPGGIFRDAIPLPDGRILVSHSPAPIDHQDLDANPDFDLYLLAGRPGFQPRGGKGLPEVSKTRLASASATGLSDIEAYPVYVRLKPKINAGKRPKREHLIRYPGMEEDRRPATYLERNFLLIDAILRDPSPVGKRVAYERDPVTGEATAEIDRVKYLRLVEALPVTPALARPLDRRQVANGDPQSTLVSNGIHPLKRIVGEAALCEDGSIYLKVPSKTPLIIQSLNGDRMALRQEARYYFFVPNEPFTISPSPSETFQTCGSCMGALSGRAKDLFGPKNPFAGQAFVKAIAQAKGNPPALGLKIEERSSIDFARDIQPLFDRHCVACHTSGKEPGGGLVLTGDKTRYYTRAYENLMQLEDPTSGWYGRKKYVSERNALAIESYLIEKIWGRELKAPRELEGDVPHPSRRLFLERGLEPAPLTAEQRLLLVRWIDLGAAFLGPERMR